MSSKKSSTKKTTTKPKAAKKPVKKPAAKKPLKKSSAKKVVKKAAKKSVSKKGEENLMKLAQAKGMKCFWVNEGPILKNLLELEAALEKMSDEMFGRHVSKNRNDFAEWVEHVLMDSETAVALRKAKKPATARKVVVRQLKLYKLPK